MEYYGVIKNDYEDFGITLKKFDILLSEKFRIQTVHSIE